MRSRVKRETPTDVHVFVILVQLRGIRDLCDIDGMSTTADTERWVPDGHTFAARLALVRQRMVWNIKEAARECTLSDSSWREWELSGRLPRDYETVCKQIADVAGCDLHWLMTGDPAMPPSPPGRTFPKPQRTGSVRRLRPVADVTEDRRLDDLVTVGDDDRWSWYTKALADDPTSKPVGCVVHHIRPAVSFTDISLRDVA